MGWHPVLRRYYADPDLHDDASKIDSTLCDWFREVLVREAEAIRAAAQRCDSRVARAVRVLEAAQGHVVVTGMGKMGCVARKAAATLSSTGTPAIFLDPADAMHGSLGMVVSGSVLLALSNSGETREVLDLLPFMLRQKVATIAVTGSPGSALARHADVVLDSSVTSEADPDSIAPTSSSTVALAICDALAVTLMRLRGFTKEQFAIFHPGGHLGKKLLLKVTDVMHTQAKVPSVAGECSLGQAIATISEKNLGCVFVCDDQGTLEGIITDGDVRRTFAATASSSDNPLVRPSREFMTSSPATVAADELAAVAINVMEEKQISVLPVVGARKRIVGVVHLHDLIRSGLA